MTGTTRSTGMSGSLKGRRVKGSILFTAALSIIVVSLLTGCLVIVGQINNTTKTYLRGQKDSNNVVTAAEICCSEAGVWLTRLNLEAIDNPIKGDEFYNVLLESLREEITTQNGVLDGITCEQILDSLPMMETEFRDLFIQEFGKNGLDSSEVRIDGDLAIDTENEDNVMEFQTGDALYLQPISITTTLREGISNIKYTKELSGFYVTAIYDGDKILLQLEAEDIQTESKDVTIW